MGKKAAVKYRSLRSNLVHLPLSLYAQLAQQQARPQSLILHLSPLTSSSSSRPPKTAYLGWSGLAAASSLASAGGGAESVEVDPEVAMSLGWSEGTILEISVIHNPTKATSVSVTPLTTDDWEILEQHASFLENHLLSQLRAAQKGQELDVWVMGRTKIRIRVDETNPASSSNSAVLINPDTEIYVAPRPRSASSPRPQRVIQPESSSSSSSAKGKAKQRDSIELRLVPARIAAAWGEPQVSSEQATNIGTTVVALCSHATFRRAMKRWKGQVEVATLAIKILPSPTEIDEPKEGGDSVANGSQHHEEQEATLLEWAEIPDGHLALLGGSKKGWLGDWDIVRISQFEAKSARRKTSKGKAPSWEAPPISPAPAFPGTCGLLEDATAYLRQMNNTSSNRPLLLLGSKGSGKTSLVKIIAANLEKDQDTLMETIYKDVTRIDPESRLSIIKDTMTGWIEKAKRRSPCLLALDGLDSLLPPETEISSSGNPAILADLFCRLLSPFAIPQGIVVLVTATSNTALHPTLNTKHVFGETVKIPPLTKETRQELIQAIVQNREASETVGIQTNGFQDTELDYIALGGATEGYSATDLHDLIRGARQQAIIRCSKEGVVKLDLSMEDFRLAQAAFTPLSLRGVSLQKSEVKWSDIGGLTEPRRVLRETLEWPTKYAQIFANCPLRLRSGLLLYGFPGCGKTLLASAVAKECGLNFISVKGPEILNKYIGASEKAVRDLFERASAAKPCILFFDEFDSIAPKRGHDSTGVTDRVVNQMLTEMDGAQGLEGVYVLAATSRPDLIDSALLRPGRLDKSILCDMPDFSDRLEILKALSGELHLGRTVDLETIAQETPGFSGADLQAVVYNAHLEVVHSSLSDKEATLDAKEKGKGKSKVVENGDNPATAVGKIGFRQINPEEIGLSAATRTEVGRRVETVVRNTTAAAISDGEVAHEKESIRPQIEQIHLLRSLDSTRLSVSTVDRKRLEHIYRVFVNDREGKMGDGDLGRDTGTRVSLM